MPPSFIIDDQPYFIEESGLYTLADNLEMPGKGIAILVTADNVKIDMNGHTLSGAFDRTVDSTGIRIMKSNVEIFNGGISGFMRGVMALPEEVDLPTNNIHLHNLNFGYNDYRAIIIRAGDNIKITSNKIHHTGKTLVTPDSYGIAVELLQGKNNKITDNIITETYGTGVGEGVAISLSNRCNNCEIIGNKISNSEINKYSGTFGVWTSSPPETSIKITGNVIENMLYGICRKASAHKIEVVDNVFRYVHCISPYDNIPHTNAVIEKQKCYDEIDNHFLGKAISGNAMAMHKHAISKSSADDRPEKYEWLYKAAGNGIYESRRVLKRDAEIYKIKEAQIWNNKLNQQEFLEKLPFITGGTLFVAIIMFIVISYIRRNKYGLIQAALRIKNYLQTR